MKKEKNNAVKPKDNRFSYTPYAKELNKHRSNIKEVLLWSNATPIRRYGDLGYVCCYCDNQYQQPADLKKHTLECHTDVRKAFFFKISVDRFVIRLDITSLHCKICNRSIDTVEELTNHLQKDHQKTIFTDIKCHITPFKFDSETLRCCICMNTFSKFKILLEHMHTHYRNYICEVCDVGFINVASFTNHMLTHDTGTYKCNFCLKEFDSKNKRRLHERQHSLKPLLFKCGHCTETFNDYRKKEIHLALAHGQEQKCQACEKTFKNTKALNNHVRRNHLMERPHKCTECDMAFYKPLELRNHMVKHTGQRSYKCTVCSKAFGRSSTLKEHMKIHDDVRRFKCEHCGQAFVQKCSWKGHMKSKHGETV